MTQQAPEEQLEHWRGKLARVLKAAPDMPWPNLIEWAEEANEWARKAATRKGREQLGQLEERATNAETKAAGLVQDLERLSADMSVYRAEILRLQDELETAAYDRTWPADRTRPADVQREVDKAVAAEQRRTRTVEMQFKAASERWRRQREDLVAKIPKSEEQ
ncbi:hypothetical protein ACWY4P_53720 (plasmid) [Streptomyces sp. LZ34]